MWRSQDNNVLKKKKKKEISIEGKAKKQKEILQQKSTIIEI